MRLRPFALVTLFALAGCPRSTLPPSDAQPSASASGGGDPSTRATPQADVGRDAGADGGSRAVSASPDADGDAGSMGLTDVAFEGRVGADLAEICAAWKKELLAVVAHEQKAGHGLEGYDAGAVQCSAEAAPRLEGSLPRGWAIASAVAIHYFDGVAVKSDRFLVLRRADGKTVAGPMYSTSNDIGDSGAPLAWRLAVVPSKGAPALVMSFVSFSPYGPKWLADGGVEAGSTWTAEHEGRVCRFMDAHVTCDAPHFVLFATTKMDKRKHDAFLAAPRAELPKLDTTTGAIMEIARSGGED